MYINVNIYLGMYIQMPSFVHTGTLSCIYLLHILVVSIHTDTHECSSCTHTDAYMSICAGYIYIHISLCMDHLCTYMNLRVLIRYMYMGIYTYIHTYAMHICRQRSMQGKQLRDWAHSGADQRHFHVANVIGILGR